MSKAEELASKEWSNLGFCNNEQSNAFKLGYLKGYHQAQKNLELTVNDIKNIDRLLNQCVDCSNPYQEVLKRFKEQRTQQYDIQKI